MQEMWLSQPFFSSLPTKKYEPNIYDPNLSDYNSRDSILTLDLSPQPEEVLIVKGQEFKSKIHMTVKIKGGHEAIFQVDTGATCNVIRAGELRGTKYEIKARSHTRVKC